MSASVCNRTPPQKIIAHIGVNKYLRGMLAWWCRGLLERRMDVRSTSECGKTISLVVFLDTNFILFKSWDHFSLLVLLTLKIYVICLLSYAVIHWEQVLKFIWSSSVGLKVHKRQTFPLLSFLLPKFKTIAQYELCSSRSLNGPMGRPDFILNSQDLFWRSVVWWGGKVHYSIVSGWLHWRDYWHSNHFALHFHSLMYLILWDLPKSWRDLRFDT